MFEATLAVDASDREGTTSATQSTGSFASVTSKIRLASHVFGVSKPPPKETGNSNVSSAPERLTGSVRLNEESRVVRWPIVPKLDLRRIIYAPIQEWEGVVLNIDREVFSAQLVDKTRHQSRPEEIVELPLSDIREDDKNLLKPGAIFRWTIGYQDNEGTKERVSRIIFRRLPAWKKSDLDATRNPAAVIMRTIEWL